MDVAPESRPFSAHVRLGVTSWIRSWVGLGLGIDDGQMITFDH